MVQNVFSILFLLSILASGVELTAQDFIFETEHYGIDEGLVHREINAIHQCQRGFIWVGTPKGLSRYDGYEFIHYNSRTDSFLHDNIWRILEDADGWFWLIPLPPFNDFDIWHPVTKEKTRFSDKFGKDQSVPLIPPARWVVDQVDQSLVGPLDAHRLFSYHPETGIRYIELKDLALFGFEKNRHFGQPLISAQQTFWVLTTKNEIAEIDLSGLSIQKIQHPFPLQFNASIQSSAMPFVYFEWNSDRNIKKKSFWMDRKGDRHVMSDPYWYPSILPGKNVSAIGEDLLYDGFSFYNLAGDSLFSLPTNQKLDATSNFRSFIFTEKGEMWTGGDFGLQKISIRKNPFINYLKDEEGHRNAIRGIVADESKITLNVEHLGPAFIDRRSGNLRQTDYTRRGFGNYAIKTLTNGRVAFGQGYRIGIIDTSQSTVFDTVGFFTWSIFQIDDHTLWLGSDEGLHNFDLRTGEVTPFEKYNGFEELRSATITHIASGRDGLLRLCTDDGFYKVDPAKGILARYSESGEGRFKIPHQVVYHFFEDLDGTFWLASKGGLIKLSEKTGNRSFTTLDGLSNDVIYAVYPGVDSLREQLWLSSDQGIMRFNKTTGAVETFLTADGLPNNEFNRLAHFQDDQGQLFFGTINGATTFHPKDFEKSMFLDDPPLRITEYYQFDGEENRMVEKTTEILQQNQITLLPDDRFFRIKVALLNFSGNIKNRFAYRFSGISEEWEYSAEHILRFGRLPYGNYELQIKAQDQRGHWSKNELHIPVTVLRPFYLQTWFLVSVTVSLLAGIFLFFKIRTRQLKQRQRELEAIVLERTMKIQEDKTLIEKQAAELQLLEKLKSRFFANVSHELRTPLTLMLGPVNSILKRKKTESDEARLLQFVRRNGEKLQQLINEILDLSKLESGKMEVEEEPVLFYPYLKEQMAQFHSAASSGALEFEFRYEADESLLLMLDKKKFEKIIHNYLSNALKFTPPDGKITFTVATDNDYITISVTDTGKGIHPNDLPYIFDRFYQAKQADAKTEGGTGIGLSLVKELAELLGGEVWVDSKLLKGSIFYYRFPILMAKNNSHLLVSGGAANEMDIPSDQAESVIGELLPINAQPTADKANILIVEDNSDLREYLRFVLSDYQITTAENGKVALDCLDASDDFQLIISDLMMPVMDGFQFLENIKSDDQRRHIPTIMLTAKVNARTKLKALRIGVDDYLTKPFQEDELKARIKNLLHNYRVRMETFAKDEASLPSERKSTSPVITNSESTWLADLEQYLLANLDDNRLNTEFIAMRFNLSGRQFHRRLKQLTGMTPNQYLQEIRLQTARDLLVSGKIATVKVAAAKVGFQDVRYFSRIFENLYGAKPSEMRK